MRISIVAAVLAVNLCVGCLVQVKDPSTKDDDAKPFTTRGYTGSCRAEALDCELVRGEGTLVCGDHGWSFTNNGEEDFPLRVTLKLSVSEAERTEKVVEERTIEPGGTWKTKFEPTLMKVNYTGDAPVVWLTATTILENAKTGELVWVSVAMTALSVK
jgi:hypothetical protein